MRLPWRRLGLLVAALAGIACMCVPYVTLVDFILHGHNDFAALYASARLVTTPYLYDPAASLRLREELAGEYGGPAPAVYPAAFLCGLPMAVRPHELPGQLLDISSRVAGVAHCLDPVVAGRVIPMLLACCWSLPASAVLAQGQDVFFLVLWITLALRWAGHRPLAAGLALALCASKFHLFFPIPLLLAARREGRMAAGVGLGGALLALVSFGVAGGTGPHVSSKPSPRLRSPGPQIMPNLHNLVAGLPGCTVWELILALACAAMVWVVARRTNWQIGLAAALVAGLLTSVHAYPADRTC